MHTSIILGTGSLKGHCRGDKRESFLEKFPAATIHVMCDEKPSTLSIQFYVLHVPETSIHLLLNNMVLKLGSTDTLKPSCKT